jgi:tetratricopeptide (TPR) repeat protein
MFSIISFYGCGSVNPEDFNPSKNKISKLLPYLEPLMDINSFENAYIGKSTTNPGVLCSAKQDKKNYLIDDASLVFFRDARFNITDSTSDKRGYIVCKITNYTCEDHYPVPLLILGIGTFLVAPALGIPMYTNVTNLGIEVEIRNIKGEVIASYLGEGESTASGNSLYYLPNHQKGNLKAVRLALDKIKLKISRDCDVLTTRINKSMQEINQDREFSINQSALEPDELLEGNKKFYEKDYSSSIPLYNSVLDKYPFHIHALLNRGKAQIELGNNNVAIKDFGQVIELDEKNVDAYYFRGVSYSNLLEFYAAINNYDKVILLNPDMVQVYLMRASAEEELELYKNAVKDYTKVLSLNPDFIYAKRRLNIVQDRIQQEKNRQEQEAQQVEQERQNRINSLTQALNTLSNSLNSGNTTNSTAPAGNTNSTNTTNQNNSSTSGHHIVKEICPHCHGLKVDPNPSYVANYGLGNASDKQCPVCGKYEIHYHKTCPICKGTGFVDTFK